MRIRRCNRMCRSNCRRMVRSSRRTHGTACAQVHARYLPLFCPPASAWASPAQAAARDGAPCNSITRQCDGSGRTDAVDGANSDAARSSSG
eukprot:scaffold136_cov418-Prasinococcus_capsulatus_cf.AAC.2